MDTKIIKLEKLTGKTSCILVLKKNNNNLFYKHLTDDAAIFNYINRKCEKKNALKISEKLYNRNTTIKGYWYHLKTLIKTLKRNVTFSIIIFPNKALH